MSRRVSSAWTRVYDVVRRIPRGRVSTYGEVAAAAGFARAARVAGWALHALPPGSDVPWHRVVAAGGRLSLARLDVDAALTQRLRLEREGVRFDARGRVDLASCRAKLKAADARSKLRGKESTLAKAPRRQASRSRRPIASHAGNRQRGSRRR